MNTQVPPADGSATNDRASSTDSGSSETRTKVVAPMDGRDTAPIVTRAPSYPGRHERPRLAVRDGSRRATRRPVVPRAPARHGLVVGPDQLGVGTSGRDRDGARDGDGRRAERRGPSDP